MLHCGFSIPCFLLSDIIGVHQLFPLFVFLAAQGTLKAGLRLSTATTKLANWPTTDAADDIVVSLSALFNWDFVVHNASDAVVPDSKNESTMTPVDSLSAPTTRGW